MQVLRVAQTLPCPLPRLLVGNSTVHPWTPRLGLRSAAAYINDRPALLLLAGEGLLAGCPLSVRWDAAVRLSTICQIRQQSARWDVVPACN
jgi:hypothetical protein